MAYTMDRAEASVLTRWANSPGGAAAPELQAPMVEMPDLSRLMAGFDAPLPPPQKIDFAGIEREAAHDMSAKFADLPELRGYWAQPATPAPMAERPAFMAAPDAAEPQVYYPTMDLEPAPAKVSLESLDRAQRYEQQALGSAFNKTATQPLPHMARRFDSNTPT